MTANDEREEDFTMIRRIGTDCKDGKINQKNIWLWYWKTEKGTWKLFNKSNGTKESSEEIEDAFTNSSEINIHLMKMKVFYTLLFTKMILQADDVEYTVRRRPKFQEEEDTEDK